ncbi:hypothetical protein KDJ21_016330 [Metabacillus litoralis]|uniref:hypothetical protein n=1 Tax=Metabacillus TaxID=2675233 RepID=UPI000EF6044E|nr:hypothetical protein [Metabacillus litoralis]MCM3164000.1 hypothetical protein [Metabacillus litoralis]MCM3410490.1 hypothetical protein [Metabacillus litoralis]UHA58418.1 hypothetical protein KDJ21_016330 [Metabacillus litoralis]
MTKQEFLTIYESRKFNLGEYIVVIDNITDEPLVMGCAFDNGVWKIYKTKERGGHYVIKEFLHENQAFDYFYELLLSRHNYLSGNS